jgi:hypothetical protein
MRIQATPRRVETSREKPAPLAGVIRKSTAAGVKIRLKYWSNTNAVASIESRVETGTREGCRKKLRCAGCAAFTSKIAEVQDDESQRIT